MQGARERLELLFDDGSFTEIGSSIKEKNDLSAVITAYGYVNGNPVYAFSQDASVNGGAIGSAHAEKILNIYRLALETGAPVVGIHDSNGAFVDGSAEVMNIYGKLLKMAAKVSGVIPQISVIAANCTGAAALFAAQADFTVISDDAQIWMSSLKDGNDFKKLAAIPAKDDADAIKQARSLVNLLPVNNLAGAPIFEYSAPQEEFDGNTDNIPKALADEDTCLEIYKNTGKNSKCYLAAIGGRTTAIVVAGDKGSKINSDDASKIANFVRVCDSFSIPVVSFVDSEGFEAEDSSEVKAMTRLENAYAESTSPKISIVSGKAQGIAFMAMACREVSCDLSFAYENASIMPMNAEAAVEFLWHDKLAGEKDIDSKRKELAKEYENTLASARSAAEKGAIDEIISPENTRKILIDSLEFLSSKRVQNLPKKHNNILF